MKPKIYTKYHVKYKGKITIFNSPESQKEFEKTLIKGAKIIKVEAIEC